MLTTCLDLECFHLLRLQSQQHLVGRQHYKAASPPVLGQSYLLLPFQSWISCNGLDSNLPTMQLNVTSNDRTMHNLLFPKSMFREFLLFSQENNAIS